MDDLPFESSAPLSSSPRAGERRKWASRGGWAVLDQGFFAAANFLVMVGLAGWLDEHDFGAFTTAYASFLFIGVFTTALLTEPMMVFGSQKYRHELPLYLGKLVGGHLIITTLGGVVLGLIALAVAAQGETLLALALGCLAVTQVSQLLPWMTRNACYLEGNPRPAAVAGFMYLALVLSLLGGFMLIGRLNVVTAVACMAVASLAANVYLLRQLRVRWSAVFRPRDCGPVLADHWRYGKWAMPTGITRYVPDQLPYIAVPALLGWWAGGPANLEAGGTLKALMNFAVPFVLLSWALSTLLLPAMVRARHTPAFRTLGRRMLWLLVGLPLLCWPVLGYFSTDLVDFAYHGKFVDHAWLLWIIGLIPALAGLDTVYYTQLKAAERPDRLFFASVVMSITLVLVGFPLVLWLGLDGAAVAIVLSYVAKVIALQTFGRHAIRLASGPSPDATPEDDPEGNADNAPDNFADHAPKSDEPGALVPMAFAPLPERPLVSVISANYNYGRYLDAAVQSVLEQTYTHWELILIDDGSTDDSAERMDAWAGRDPRITVLRQANGGQAAAWNAAFSYCRGQVLMFLDTDDLFESTKMARAVAALRDDAQVGMVQHALQVVDRDNQPVQVIPFLARQEDGWLASTILRRGGRWCFMPTSALAFRMELASRLFPLDARRFRTNADVVLFTVGPLLAKVKMLAEPLARYRIHGENRMSSGVTCRADLRKRIRSYFDTITASNAALRGLGLGRWQLDPRQHLLYQEQLFVLSSLRGGRPRRLGRYAALVRALLRDDMYRRTQRLAGVVLYGSLLVMPTRWRGPWLDHTRSFGRLKGVVQKLLRRGGGPTPPPSQPPTDFTPTRPGPLNPSPPAATA